MRFRRGLFVLLCLFVFCVSFCFASGDSLSGSDEPSGDSLYAGEEVITTYSVLSPITPDNTSGLVSVVVSLIGNYNPIVAEHRYQNTNGTWSYVREIQPDFTWIISAAIFALVLYCVFRLWGAFFCRK